MSLGGVLGSILSGGGRGISQNATTEIADRNQRDAEQRANDTYNERYTQQRDDQIADQETKLAQQKELEDIRHGHNMEVAQVGADAKAKRGEETKLARRINDFDSNAVSLVKQIDKVATSSDMNEKERVKALVPLYARLDDYLVNNENLLERSTMGSVFVGVRAQGVKLVESLAKKPQEEPVPDENTKTKLAFQGPGRPDNTPRGTATADGRNDGRVTSLQEHEYLKRTPGIIRRMAGSISDSVSNPVAQGEKTEDYSGFSVRPF